ncbi:MAG: YbhB/YbcL family Raf kinase inhibitor-like protein [Pedobacter sp.]|nr:YbhB/YbcL family Raf kinase inhibitor-like protein [Chitinophagaceae bacterium]
MTIKHLLFGVLIIGSIVTLSCKKDSLTTAITTSGTFTASSGAFTNDGVFPKLYTCDSTGISPKLSWVNAPTGTTSFAITMHHIPPTPPNHVYMLLYNIPVTITSIADAVSGIGLFGINTVNGQTSYTPPCSQGPGAKLYTITVYALSSAPVFSVPQSQVTMDIFLTAISTKTLATSILNVTYTR